MNSLITMLQNSASPQKCPQTGCLGDIIMADIGRYRHHVCPVMKDYDACTTDCDEFLTGNCSGYRHCIYDVRPSRTYPVIYGNSRDLSNMAPPVVVSQAKNDTGSCTDVCRMSVDFKFQSHCSNMVQGQRLSTSTTLEIYPWMKETRQNRKRHMLVTLPGQLPNYCQTKMPHIQKTSPRDPLRA